MFKKISLFLVVLFLLSTGALFAQSWNLLSGSNVVDVAVADDGSIFLVNKAGELYHSSNLGVNWTLLSATGVTRVSASSDASNLGIVNKSGEFYYSKDKGKTWKKTNATGVVDASIGKTHSFIVNSAGGVFFTSDFSSWQQVQNVKDMKLIVFGGSFIMTCDKNGNVKTGGFNGTTAVYLEDTGAKNVVDIDIAPKGELWIVNSSGEVYTSSNKGKNWNADKGPTGVKAVSLCNKYMIIANKNGEAYLRK